MFNSVIWCKIFANKPTHARTTDGITKNNN